MLPNEPQPIETLRARYPAALEFVFDQQAVHGLGLIRPGEMRANVFDHEDGLRLIVSRERDPEGRIWLHYSASFPGECRIVNEVRLLCLARPKSQVMSQWIRSVPERFAELSGDRREATAHWRSETGIPHWIIAEESS